MTSFRAGVLLRAANLILYALWLHRLRAAAGALISLTLPSGLIAGYVLLNAAAALARRELGARREGILLALDVVVLTWTTFWAKAWGAEVHMAFLVPLTLAALRLAPGAAAGVAALAAAAVAAVSWAAPGAWLPVYTFRLIVVVLAPLAAALFSAASLHRSSGQVHAEVARQRTLIYNEFLNHMLFQIRDYLTSISTVIEHLGLTAKDPVVKDLGEKLRRTVAELNGKLGRMLDTVKHNTTSRSKPLKVHFELEALLRESLTNAQAAAGETQASVRFDVARSIGALQGDREQIATALTAALTNALEAVQAHGIQGKVWVRARLEDNAARVDVGDNGPGMTPEAVGRVFTPLTTTKAANGALGLSLSMSRRMLERVGGTILVKSEAGKGTTVRLDVPLKPSLPIVRNEESTWAGRRANPQ